MFSVETEAVHARNGNLEHFYGDLFASYWGAPRLEPRSADLAMAAALEIIPRLNALKTELPPKFKNLFGYGIALHVGPAVVGNVGGKERLDYMVLGDAINTAARIESLTKHYGVLLLASRQLLDRLATPAPARLVDRVILKGKTEPMELWEPAHPDSPPHFATLMERYRDAWALYEAGRFKEAAARFERLDGEFSDLASRVLAQRCCALDADQPPNWRGVFKLDFK
jgi:adenylate cyclase